MSPAIMNWSGGKDSALCLYYVLKNNLFDVRYLFTTLNNSNKRISMHGVSEFLLEQQSKAIGIELKQVYLPENSSMHEYEYIISTALKQLKSEGINHSIFGDIFLEDLRKYRENQLAKMGFNAVFPLWKRETTEIALDFIDQGFKSIIVSVDSEKLDKSFAGRIYNHSFLNDLPKNVDPCGENGEFHSFVFDGPIFSDPILFKKGEIVYKEYPSENKYKKNGFWYCDLLEK
ncbi:MAG: diphthine--ammonia ligase [Bacteroidales bacterium]